MRREKKPGRRVTRAALDERPVIVALAGPNGAGKSTFHQAFLRTTGLRFVNADDIGATLGIDAYEAARVADAVRRQLVVQRESFIFETVFSDPIGEKVSFLEGAAASGYTVVLCFIGVRGPSVSRERVAMRLSQGGHDVPDDKIAARYRRSLANLKRAIAALPIVIVFDNDDLSRPFRRVAEFAHGERVWVADSIPTWLRRLGA